MTVQTKKESKEEVTLPKKFGLLDTKKIKEWIRDLTNERDALKEENIRLKKLVVDKEKECEQKISILEKENSDLRQNLTQWEEWKESTWKKLIEMYVKVAIYLYESEHGRPPPILQLTEYTHELIRGTNPFLLHIYGDRLLEECNYALERLIKKGEVEKIKKPEKGWTCYTLKDRFKFV